MTDKEIIKPPDRCDCCEQPPALIQVVVEDTETNIIKRGPFSNYQKFGTNKRILRPRYRFKAWWARCANCFYTDTHEQEEMFG